MECDEHAAQVRDGVCGGCMARAFAKTSKKRIIIIMAATAAQMQSHVDHTMYPVSRCVTWDCVFVNRGVIAAPAIPTRSRRARK